MKLAILHYHLNRGGVTRVIANHLQALRESDAPVERALVICGGRANDWSDKQDRKLQPIPVARSNLPLLEYDIFKSDRTGTDGKQLADAIEAELQQHEFANDETILHVHNHSLGKNLALPPAIAQLATRGHRFLLQIHDYIEDHRPAAYQSLGRALDGRASIGEYLYPQATHLHYAVLNSRDHDVLRRAGVAPTRLHFLPNPVEDFTALPDGRLARQKVGSRGPLNRRLVFYPVRGIRRKNLGEFLLWAAVGGDDTSYALSLAPRNPAERKSYDSWVAHAKRLGLPVLFDTGGDGTLSFPESLAASDALITTSVAEGFGMVFLESWLAGRPLIGRDIPEISADFRRSGLDFRQLSPEFLIPIAWLERNVIRDELTNAFGQLLRAYGQQSDVVTPAIEQILDSDSIEFSTLTPMLQTRIIESCASRSHPPADLLALNPWLSTACEADAANCHDLIVANAEAVRKSYGPAAVGKLLQQAYAAVANSPVTDELAPLPHDESIVQSFLDITRLHPVRFA